MLTTSNTVGNDTEKLVRFGLKVRKLGFFYQVDLFHELMNINPLLN